MSETHEKFKPGDLVWVVGLSGSSLSWGVSCGLVLKPENKGSIRSILLDGVPLTWSSPWYKTEGKAQVALEEKLASYVSIKDVLTSQSMTKASDFCLKFEYKYGSDEDESKV
jgi:hypothetical protein|tara:strand:+ start:60 stop:395 length:336 start_codon:yes stop_codon:yes gene_type:complete